MKSNGERPNPVYADDIDRLPWALEPDADKAPWELLRHAFAVCGGIGLGTAVGALAFTLATRQTRVEPVEIALVFAPVGLWLGYLLTLVALNARRTALRLFLWSVVPILVLAGWFAWGLWVVLSD